MTPIPARPAIRMVEDAIFTLEKASPAGTYFSTPQGPMITRPDDHITVIASTNTPNTSSEETNKIFTKISEGFDNLIERLDMYIEKIATKEPDVQIIDNREKKFFQGSLSQIGA